MGKWHAFLLDAELHIRDIGDVAVEFNNEIIDLSHRRAREPRWRAGSETQGAHEHDTAGDRETSGASALVCHQLFAGTI